MFVYNTNDAILKLRYSNADPVIPFTIHGGKMQITEFREEFRLFAFPRKYVEKKKKKGNKTKTVFCFGFKSIFHTFMISFYFSTDLHVLDIKGPKKHVLRINERNNIRFSLKLT